MWCCPLPDLPLLFACCCCWWPPTVKEQIYPYKLVMQFISSLLLLLLAVAWHGSAFVSRPAFVRIASLQKSGTSLNGLMQPFLLAEAGDGLDADTLQALGEVTELNDALDGALTAANPAVVSGDWFSCRSPPSTLLPPISHWQSSIVPISSLS